MKEIWLYHFLIWFFILYSTILLLQWLSFTKKSVNKQKRSLNNIKRSILTYKQHYFVTIHWPDDFAPISHDIIVTDSRDWVIWLFTMFATFSNNNIPTNSSGFHDQMYYPYQCSLPHLAWGTIPMEFLSIWLSNVMHKLC